MRIEHEKRHQTDVELYELCRGYWRHEDTDILIEQLPLLNQKLPLKHMGVTTRQGDI